MRTETMMPDARLGRHAAVIAILLILAGGLACAYFNTYSNAKRLFREAENMPLDGQGNVSAGARKKYDESIARCQKLLDLYPESSLVDDAIFLMGRAYFMKEEYTRSLKRLDELDERFPDHPFKEEVYYLRGVSHVENGDESRAISVLKRLEEDFPQSRHLAEGIFRSGEAEYNLGSWQAAIDAYRRLLAAFSDSEWNDTARLKIAKCQRELGQDSLAVDTLAELNQQASDRGIAFEGQLLRAEILLDQKRFEESRSLTEELEGVAQNFQSRPEVLLLNAKVYEAQDELGEAVTLLENVAKEFPKSVHAAEAWYRIGLIRQLREGELAEALKSYENVPQELPRGLFAELAQSKKRAIQDFLEMEESFAGAEGDSSMVQLQFRLAENQFLRLENPQKALEEYRKVLELFPDDPMAPSALYAIAYIHRSSLGDTSAALNAAAELLELYPDSEAAAFVTNWSAELGGTP